MEDGESDTSQSVAPGLPDTVPRYLGLQDTDGPERPYSDPQQPLPERETTQTDHLNARLLSAFDKLLAQGFKPTAAPRDAFSGQRAAFDQEDPNDDNDENDSDKEWAK